MKVPRSNRVTGVMVRESGLKLSPYIRWRKFLDSTGLVEVTSLIHGASDTTKFPSIAKMPIWAMGYALTFRVTNPSEARAAVELVIAHIHSSSSHTAIPILLILSVHALADQQVIDPLPSIVELFLARRRLLSQYGLFLQALSRFPPSQENHAVMSVIIEKMQGEEGFVPEDICVPLLQSNSSSVPLAQRLERLLSVADTKITDHLAHLFFRVYTKNGATSLAIKHLPSVLQFASLTGNDDRLLSQNSSSALVDNSTNLRSRHDGDTTSSVAGSSQHVTPSKDNLRFVPPGIKTWTSLLDFSSKSKTISADQLIALFDRIRGTHPPTTISFTVLMRALVSRRAYQRAIETWHEMLAEGHPIDVESLSAVVEACTLARKHWEAFYILEVVVKKGLCEGTVQPTSKDPYPRIQLTTGFIAMFMKSLARSGRPDVAFMVWDHAELLYGVTPDTSVLNVLLEIAQTVIQFEETFTGFWANLRARRSLSHPDKLSSPSLRNQDRGKVIESLRLTLNHDSRKKHKPTGLWGDVPAWQKTIRISYHAVIGNNPGLLHIPSPVTSIRSSMDDIHRRPWAELIRSVQGPLSMNEAFYDVDVNSPASLARLGLYPLQAYPRIKPTNTTFHNLIYLLGMCGQASQIPMVLAWMKELGIIPFGRTTAVALIFWAEVSLRAPLFEQFGGEGEYSKLLKWLEAWVGESRMPGQDRMTLMSKVIAKARDGHGKSAVDVRFK